MGRFCDVKMLVTAEKVGICLHDTAEVSAKLVRACTWAEQEDIEMIVEREVADSVEVTKVCFDGYVDGGSGSVRITCLADEITEETVCEITGIAETSPTPKSWEGSKVMSGKKFQFKWYYHQDTARKTVYTLNREVHLKA